MFDLYTEALHMLFKFARKLPKDIALMRVYDYYDGEKLYDYKSIVKHLYNGLDYDFNEDNEDIKDTVINFSATTYAKEFARLFNLLNDKQKAKVNKLSKPLFTLESTLHYDVYTSVDFTLNKKLHNKDVLKVIAELQTTVAKLLERTKST